MKGDREMRTKEDRRAGVAALLFAATALMLGASMAGERGARPAGDAFEAVERLGRGVNIIGYDPIWEDLAKARFKERHFELIRAAGFRTVRINLHALQRMGPAPDYELAASWLKTLDWAVERALAKGLMVILDLHNYNDVAEDPPAFKPRLMAFWRQIGERYKGAPDALLFEILNEPNGKLDGPLWNTWLAEALAVIRATNPGRTVVVGPPDWNGFRSLDALALPEDDRNIIVTVHYYEPFPFTHQGAPWSPETVRLSGVTWGSTKERLQLSADFARVQAWSTKHRRPILLGEFGAYEKAPMASRVLWTDAVARTAESLGWAWTYWQFDSDFIVYDIDQDRWVGPILKALIPHAHAVSAAAQQEAALADEIRVNLPASSGQSPSLADLYRSGRVRLVEEARVTDAQLPKGVNFENPRGLAVDAAGNVYVTDFGACNIKVFGPDGKFLRVFGQKGQGPADLGAPESIEVAAKRICVQEVENRRLSILDLDGKYVASVPFAPDANFGRFLGLRSLPDGRLVVGLERGLPAGFGGRMPEDQDQAVLIYAEDLKTTRIIFEKRFRSSCWGRNPDNNALHRIIFPYHPKVMFAVSPSGKVAIGYNAKYEIELYDPDKGLVNTVTHSYDPIRLEERDKKAFFDLFRMAVYVNNIRKVLPRPPDYIVRLTEFPELLPPYGGLAFDSEGNLLVNVFTKNRATNVYDVFSPDGRFVHQILIEGTPLSWIYRFSGNNIWQIERDADEVASLVRYRIALAN
jgi:endoglucanase